MSPVHITATRVPEGSVVHAALAGADFADCYETPDPQPGTSALQAWLDGVARTPGWIDALMALRNRAVRLVGLKDLGALGPGTLRRDAASYRCGERVGIFEIWHLSPGEVVMGQKDRHLDVQVSLYKRLQDGQPVLSQSTVVHIHNPLGRVYMALVKPFHRRIAPAMLARLAARPAPAHGPR
jgi:hypothetical protein